MEALISASDFMEHLKANDLVIVSKTQLLDNETLKLELLRKDLLKRKSLSMQQVVNGQFLPVRSKSGIRSYILSGKIKQSEIYPDGHGRIMILTSAIKRLYEAI